MRKAGGIAAIIAGVFGVLAAFLTLAFGSFGSAFQISQARLVVYLGWDGLVFSFLVIILGTVSLSARSRWPSVFLVLCAICGIVLGGTFVAVFMALALIGGLLGLFAENPAGDGSSSLALAQEPATGLANADEVIARYLSKQTKAADKPEARAPLSPTAPGFGKRRH